MKKYYKGKFFLAKEKDWSTEYLSAAVSVKCVKNLESAIEHINKYVTMHTDIIITINSYQPLCHCNINDRKHN